MKKVDLILIIVYFIISIVLFQVITVNNTNYDEKYVVVKVDNDIIIKEELSKDKIKEIPVENKYGKNIIRISNGFVEMIESDCYNQICVNHGKISHVNEIIVCLPNHLIIEIKGKKTETIDSISY